MVRRHARVSIGATTTPRTWPCKLEYLPDPQGAPEYVPYVPARARSGLAGAVQQVSRADRRAVRVPGVPHRAAGSATTMDAKVATADMASHLMVWAAIGKPNQREWVRRAVARQRLREERRPVSLRLSSVPRRSLPTGCAPRFRRTRRRAWRSRPRKTRTDKTAHEKRLRHRTGCGKAGFCPPAMPIRGSWRARRPIIATCSRTILEQAGRTPGAPRTGACRSRPLPRNASCARRGQRRAVPGCAAPQHGRRRFPETDARLLRRQHHQDRDRAVVPGQGRTRRSPSTRATGRHI